MALLPIHLPHFAEELSGKVLYENGMGAYVGYHSAMPVGQEQKITEPTGADCIWTGGRCFGDGSVLRAHEWYEVFLQEGMDRIWEMLEEEWTRIFGPEKEK